MLINFIWVVGFSIVGLMETVMAVANFIQRKMSGAGVNFNPEKIFKSRKMSGSKVQFNA